MNDETTHGDTPIEPAGFDLDAHEPPPGDEVIEVHGHEQLILDNPRVLYQVMDGHVAIYMVRVNRGQVTGQRQYLFTCHQGAVMTGRTRHIYKMSYVLVAVPIGDCRVRPRDAAAALDPASAQYAPLWDGLDTWIGLVCENLVQGNEAAGGERIALDAAIEGGEGHVIRPAERETGWLRVSAGRVNVVGDPEATIEPADPPMAMMNPAWIECAAPSTCSLSPRDYGADHRLLYAGVMTLNDAFIHQTWRRQRARNEAEVERLSQLAKRRETEDQAAIESLSLERDDPIGRHLDDDVALDAAMRIIGRIQNMEFEVPVDLDRNQPLHEQIELIARASGTRKRRVYLAGHWWDDDVGTLIAFRKETRTPVVLFLVSGLLGLRRWYEMVDLESGQRVKVTDALADELDTEAYSFIEPLPVMEDGLSLKKLASFTFRPFYKDIRLMFLLSLVGGLLGTLMPVANFLMIDKVIPDANRSLMWDLALGLSAMSIGLFIFSLSQSIVTLRVKTGITARLQSAIIDRLLRLPVRFFNRYSSGDLLNRSMMISEISAGVSMTVMTGLFGLISTLIMLAMCFYYSSKLAWLALGTAILTSVISLSFSYILRKKALVIEVGSGKLFGFMVQLVHGVSKLQMAGAESRAFNQWAKDYGTQLRQGYDIATLQHYLNLINMTLQTGSTAVLFYFAGSLVEASEAARAIDPLAPQLLTIGTFFAFQGAFQAVVGGFVSYFESFMQLHQQLAKRDLVRPILEEQLEDGAGMIDPGRLEGHVHVNDVHFRYREGGPVILNGVDIEAYPGEFIALVGGSGSGKSTVLKLLLGFEEPESGSVYFDRKDVATLDMNLVRRQVGVVLQDGTVNAGSLFLNIAGASQITLEEAWEAAEDAGFGDDIRAMPMGMQTLVPEGARTLSGGQRQRLMIARALALNPRVVIFDEATSALDNRTQEIVTESLRKRKVTRIVVAHRLSTIKDADRIYVLDRGRVAQMGSYAELSEKPGLFRKLVERQTG